MKLDVVSNRGLDFKSTDLFELEDQSGEEEVENPVFDREFVSDDENDEEIEEE